MVCVLDHLAEMIQFTLSQKPRGPPSECSSLPGLVIYPSNASLGAISLTVSTRPPRPHQAFASLV